MSYDIPFRGRSGSLTKELAKKQAPKRTTDAEVDPWGATVPSLALPTTPPTMADLISQFEAESGYGNLPRVTTPLSPPTRVPSGRGSSVPTPTPTADTTIPSKYELDPASRRIREVEEFESGAESRAARIQEESQIYPDEPEEGSWFYNRGVTEPPGPRVPLDFTTGEGFLGEAAGIGLGSLYVAGQFMEPIQQPVDVIAETVIELGAMIGGGPKPTLFTAGTEDKPGGFTGALEQFRDRAWYVQILATLPAEILGGAILGKGVGLSSRATGVMD